MVDREALARIAPVYSVQLPNENKASDQRSSGRCWLFAFLNIVRKDIIRRLELTSDFELSQTHLFFYDKLERANYFLETIINTVDEPRDGRLVWHLLSDPMNDGGQWEMLAGLVAKYGIMPKAAWPEAWSSMSSGKMNALLLAVVRGAAQAIHRAADAHAGDSFATKAARGNAMRGVKSAAMLDVYRILVTCLGKPVTRFDWTYRTKSGEGFTRVEGLTPLGFLRDHAKFDVTQYVSLVNDPRNPYDRLLTVDYLNNMVGGAPVRYLNVSPAALKAAVRARLEAGHPVWFGCDVGKWFYRPAGVLDVDLFKSELVFGPGLDALDKRSRLLYAHSLMTHAMVFTACDVRGHEVRALRVENSWGSSTTDTAIGSNMASDGYLHMSAAWFDEYVYQVVVNKADVDPTLLAVLETDPIRLPAWDPMGSLAVTDVTPIMGE